MWFEYFKKFVCNFGLVLIGIEIKDLVNFECFFVVIDVLGMVYIDII